MSRMDSCIAHVRERDRVEQPLEDHLRGVADRARKNADKLGLGKAGELLGLLHDIGKYSAAFQNYIRSAEGLLDQDSDDYVDAAQQKGKIDHSTAGSRLVWEALSDPHDPLRDNTAQILALALASHHSGLIDCLMPDGTDLFTRRMEKADGKSHFSEVCSKIFPDLGKRIRELLEDREVLDAFRKHFHALAVAEKAVPSQAPSRLYFKTGLLLRVLFSCLIDADRTDTVDFEKSGAVRLRQKGEYVDWTILAARLEDRLSSFGAKGPINEGRRKISNDCKNAGIRDKGIFTLTVPTGGGKTLASLRFALHHALKWKNTPQKIDRIFYIIPYTSIIDQNARVVRDILEPPEERGKIVLECHSNLTEEKETWREKLLAENWDAPIVFTTNVQFLETLFGGGTRSVRRMHQLVNSVIIFDEIQTLPVRTAHLFCNAVNFLVERCGGTIVLCTATQPLLNGVDKSLGALAYTSDDEIVTDVPGLFETFRRVEVVDRVRPGGYADEDIASLILDEREAFETCLAIANTTETARNLYGLVKEKFENVVHLSANMCPAHRREVLEKIRTCLGCEPQIPLVCVSTQVVEAGVDVDFGAVVRCMAGLDSIAQAAGRCNRHGYRNVGRVSIVNPQNERIEKLDDIRQGREDAERVLREIRNAPASVGTDLLSPTILERYFQYYFYNRANEMIYHVEKPRSDNLLNMLSENRFAAYDYDLKKPERPISLRQSFAAAAELFKAIDAPTRGIVVPCGDGEELIARLCGEEFNPAKTAALLRQAQQYSVNIYPGVFDVLQKQDALYEIRLNSDRTPLGVWALREEYYSSEFGVSREPVRKSRTLDI